MPNKYGNFDLLAPAGTDPANMVLLFENFIDSLDPVLSRAGARSKATIIATEQSRTNAAYGTLTTPDKAEGIVLPTKGLICVAYFARWSASVGGAGRAAIFLGANQLKIGQQGAAPVTEAAISGVAAERSYLSSAHIGLLSSGGVAGSSGGVTTGQALASVNSETAQTFAELGGSKEAVVAAGGADYPYQGGICHIFANAGTYDVSVQFKATSGSVTALDRRLYVWTQEFA